MPERREQVLTHCGGYIYYVSLKGVTGSATLDTDAVATQVKAIKAETDLPVCVGFGIRDGASAKAIGTHADGVIVGSALVQNFANIDANDADAVAAAQQRIMVKMDELRGALDSRNGQNSAAAIEETQSRGHGPAFRKAVR